MQNRPFANLRRGIPASDRCTGRAFSIGFINDQGKKSCAENQQVSSASKLQHFHNQLEIILESVKKCQQKGGFEWNLKYKNANIIRQRRS